MEPRSVTSQPMLADLVITNGKVITVDDNFSIAQAVAVKEGKIVAVGTNEDVAPLVGKDTQVLDIKGKSMLPGINESHIHAALFGSARPPLALDVGYPTVKSISDIVEMVGKKAEAAQPGEWIRGLGWDEGYLEECLKNSARHPTRWDLDPVSPNNPVCLGDMSFHLAWVNSKALELAGITADTPTPSGGEILKDPTSGEPTGILIEFPAQILVMGVIPLWSREQKKEAILSAMKELNSLGITSITEPGLGPGGSTFQGGMLGAECISIYNDLHNEGKLTLRVNILLLFGEYGGLTLKDLQQGLPYIGIHTGFGNEWLRIAGVKIFADGIPVSPARTSWMYEEYADAPGVKGSLAFPGETDEERYNELINMIVYAHKCGFQIGIHATGDRAIDACVDGFIKAMKEEPRELHHYVIHGDFTTPQCAKRMADYNIGVNAQPGIKWTIADLEVITVGEERAAYEWPLRTLIDAGVHLAISSDAPVIYPNWQQGVEAAVLRESKATGKVSGPEQCISREEAIRAYTIEGAYQDHMENAKGSIEVGKLADFCVLDEDILTVDAHTIKDIRTLMTIVGGKIVYDAR